MKQTQACLVMSSTSVTLRAPLAAASAHHCLAAPCACSAQLTYWPITVACQLFRMLPYSCTYSPALFSHELSSCMLRCATCCHRFGSSLQPPMRQAHTEAFKADMLRHGNKRGRQLLQLSTRRDHIRAAAAAGLLNDADGQLAGAGET